MRKLLALGLVTAVGTWGCKRDKDTSAQADETSKTTDTVAPKTGDPAPEPGGEALLPWIHDDYPAALAQSREKKVPIVVDFWAAWCHTCLSMQHGVLRDPGLKDLRDRFVWLAIDTEKPENADAMKVAPVSVWPTFYVIDTEGAIHARQVGATSYNGFRAFLLGGEKSALAAREDLVEGSAPFHLREADRHNASGDVAAAAVSYRAALVAGGEHWDRRGDIAVALAWSLREIEEYKPCADLAETYLRDLRELATASAADFVYAVADCAEKSKGYPTEKLRASALETLDGVLSNPNAALSNDDRSEAMKIARTIAEKSGDSNLAQKYAKDQKKLLDDAVRHAKTPQEELTYAYHRSEVYTYLGESEAIIPWLERLGRDLPEEYDPHYRLAGVLMHLERYDEALKAIDVALERSPGGRRTGTIYRLQASIHETRGDKQAQIESLQQVVSHYEKMAPSQLGPGKLEAARKAVAEARAGAK